MPLIPGRIPGLERWEVEDKLILSNSTNKTGELTIYAGTAGEKALEIYNGTSSIFQLLATAAAASMTIQTANTLDPTVTFKTTRTAHQISVLLNESMVNCELSIVGGTAGQNTILSLKALDGKSSAMYLYSGSNYGFLIVDALDNMGIINPTQDKNIYLQVNDGGVNKSITWDADVDLLKHSAGLFNFDNDNLTTTGVYQVSGVQVVGARVIDARCDDVINSGDVTTDGVIDALRDAMIAHGLIAAA